EAMRPRLMMVFATSGPSAEAVAAASTTRTRRNSTRPARHEGQARGGPSAMVTRLRQTRDVGQVAVPLLRVEAVANHEDVGDLAPHVVEGDVGRAHPALGHESAGLDGGGAARLEVAEEIGEAEPARADPLHHEHVAPLQ